MQNLATSKPLLIVTIGHPGSGKSFFARQFAETFNAPLISFDEIRSELFNELTYTSDEDIIVARIAGLQLRELFKTKKTIIMDGGHNPKVSRTELKRVAKQHGYDVLNVWVQTDKQTSYNRATRRSKRNERDQFNRSLNDQEFVAHTNKFTPPNEQEIFVVISGKHTYPTQARIVLKKMIPSHESKPAVPPARPHNTGRRTLTIN